MAVTRDKYSNTTFEDRAEGQAYALLPLALPEYESDAKFKPSFFVNDVWHWKDTDGNECVIGLVEDNSARESYNLHAPGRRGKLRIVKDGVRYVVPNDGGLNTLALIRFTTGSPDTIYTNYVKVVCYLQSAYYLSTDRFKVRIIQNGQELYDFPLIYDATAEDAGVFPAKFQAAAYVGRYNLGIIGGLMPGTATLQVVSENGEGTYEGAKKTVRVLGAMNFALVYRRTPDGKGIPNWSDTTADPTDSANYDERWAVLVSEDMYVHNTANPLVSGVLDRLFTSTDNELIGVTSEEWLQGTQLLDTETIDDAYDKALAAIGDGWYYGIPYEGVDGATPVWVGITTTSDTAKNMNWHSDVYVSSNYRLKLSFTGSKDRTTGVYTVSVIGTFTGSVQSGTQITLNIYPEISMIPSTVPVTVTATVDSAGAKTLHTFTTSNASARYMTYQTYCSPSPKNSENGYLERSSEAIVMVSDLPTE